MSLECVDNVEVMAMEFEPDKWTEYWNDVSGKALRKELVEEARAEEMATVKRMQVWINVDRDQCIRESGGPPIKLRWVDINKGDEKTPNYRSRIVATEIRTDSRQSCLRRLPQWST